MFNEFDTPAQTGEIITATLRKLDIAAQVVELRVDTAMIRFDVDAVLVASNSNALRRFHYFFNVTFTDGPSGDNGLVMLGDITWPDEVVVFTDDGMTVTLPFHWGDDEFVTFTEDAFSKAFAIQNTEFVTLADFSIKYVLDFLTDESVRFSDLSVAWTGLHRWDESVAWAETMNVQGDVKNVPSVQESFFISEVLIGGPIITFGDSVRWSEMLFYVMDFQIQPEFVTFTDALVVSVVAATDSRPGAFIPGSALLGSPQ